MTRRPASQTATATRQKSNYAIRSIALLLCMWCTNSAALGQDSVEPIEGAVDGRSLVSVDGHQIGDSDLKLAMLVRRIGTKVPETVRRRLLEQLVDEQLMRRYLADRKAEPDKLETDKRLQRVYKSIRQTGRDPEEILVSLGSSEAALRRELELPAAWQVYFNRIVTADKVREYFTQHRPQFDGTQIRASHILLKLASDDQEHITAAQDELRDIRRQIVDGELTFAEAANEHSQAASSRRGGDLGFFPFAGQMPTSFTKTVFPLKSGDVSQPFRTQFGMHIATVTARRDGDLSLEDARPHVLRRLSEELWERTVAPLRQQAEIEWQPRPE